MASYSYTTTPVQELALTDLRQKAEAEGRGPYVDNRTFVKATITDLLAPHVASYIEKRVSRIADKFRHVDTTDAERTAAETALGLT